GTYWAPTGHLLAWSHLRPGPKGAWQLSPAPIARKGAWHLSPAPLPHRPGRTSGPARQAPATPPRHLPRTAPVAPQARPERCLAPLPRAPLPRTSPSAPPPHRYNPRAMRTLLVTGGAGFIGCNFVRLALAGGDRVVVLDKLTYAGHRESLAEVDDHPRFRFVLGDIADRELL